MIVYQGFGPVTVEIQLIKNELNVLAIVNRMHSPSHQQWLFMSSLHAI